MIRKLHLLNMYAIIFVNKILNTKALQFIY